MKRPATTHRAALAAQYGFTDVNRILADGFTADYFEVLGIHVPECWAAFEHICESDAQPKTRIYWRDEDRRRACEAINADFDEAMRPMREAKRERRVDAAAEAIHKLRYPTYGYAGDQWAREYAEAALKAAGVIE